MAAPRIADGDRLTSLRVANRAPLRGKANPRWSTYWRCILRLRLRSASLPASHIWFGAVATNSCSSRLGVGCRIVAAIGDARFELGTPVGGRRPCHSVLAMSLGSSAAAPLLLACLRGPSECRGTAQSRANTHRISLIGHVVKFSQENSTSATFAELRFGTSARCSRPLDQHADSFFSTSRSIRMRSNSRFLGCLVSRGRQRRNMRQWPPAAFQ